MVQTAGDRADEAGTPLLGAAMLACAATAIVL
jgi:hypothetical protein